MQCITIKGLPTAYYRGGLGQREILLIHGWGASGRMWLRTMWDFRREYRLWALDLPGCGDSATPTSLWDHLEYYTDHVAAFCQKMEIYPSVIVGHSLGGRITFDLARRYPHLAERLITISPTITGKLSFNLDLVMTGNIGRIMMELSRRVWPMAMANTMFGFWSPRHLGSEGVRRATEDLQRTSWMAAVGSLRAVINHDFSPNLTEITHPTLVICGNRDFVVPPDESELAADLLPDARLVMLDKVFHQPTDEVPEVTYDTIRSFLQEVH